MDANDIFTPSSEDAGRKTFTVREREVPFEVEIVNSEEAVIVCPNAFLIYKDGIRADSKTLKFGCSCRQPGASHDEQLEYQGKHLFTSKLQFLALWQQIKRAR